MFCKTIIESDDFLDLPLTAQALYFHLGMRADDDGFINNLRMIQRMIGSKGADYKLLAEKGFMVSFDSGVCAIVHWRMHNSIQKDRYKPTVYQAEKSLLDERQNRPDTDCIQLGNRLEPQVSIGKDRIDKESIVEHGAMADKPPATKRFIPPTFDEIEDYCRERNSSVDAGRFLAYYQANGWRIGRNTMKDWQAAIRTWEHGEKGYQNSHAGTSGGAKQSPEGVDRNDWASMNLDIRRY